MARPSLFTPELAKKICEVVSGGVPLSAACDTFRVSYATVREWVRRGEGRDRRKLSHEFAEFAASLREAQGKDTVVRMNRLNKAARGGEVIHEKTTTRTLKNGEVVTTTETRKAAPNPAIDMWYLSVRDPENFGPMRDARELQELIDEMRRIVRAGRDGAGNVGPTDAGSPAGGTAPATGSEAPAAAVEAVPGPPDAGAEQPSG